jgi:hypothetical protein
VCLQLKDYVEKVLQLEADKDALQLQLELLKHQQQQQQEPQHQQPAAQKASRLGGTTTTTTTTSSSSSSNEAGLAKEQELFELRLQKEQAVAAVARLKQQLLDLFGPDTDRLSGLQATLEAAAGLASSSGSRTLDVGAGADVGSSTSSSRLGSAAGGRDAAPTHSSASGAVLGGTNRMRRSAAGSASGSGAGAAAAGKLSGREAELLTTVANLKAALERAMACSTPNTRFMQVDTRNVSLRASLLADMWWCKQLHCPAGQC